MPITIDRLNARGHVMPMRHTNRIQDVRIRGTIAVLLCGLIIPQLAGCGGEYKPSPDELSTAKSIRNMGGRITMRGNRHVEVILGGTKVSDGDLPMLEELPDLELLNLQNTGITDEGARHVGRLKSLKRLSLQRSKVTDEGLAHLSGLSSLVELDLVGLPITDAGLEHLHALHKLEKLYFDPNRTSADGIRKLQDALPKTKILSD